MLCLAWLLEIQMCCVCRALLRHHAALLGENRALLGEYRALLRGYRALLGVCRALLKEYRALLGEYRGCGTCCVLHGSLKFECTVIIGLLCENIYWLFWEHIGLVWESRGLFRDIIGLF